MLRYHITSPAVMLWRTIEVAVLDELAARQGLRWRERVDLDVGCGNGVLGHALIRTIGVGFDLSAPGVWWARHHKPAYQALLRASATAMPLASGSQQLVFSNSVIEHIPDRRSLFDELARVLAPGGWLLLSTVSEQFRALMLGQARPDPQARAAIDRSYDHYHYYSAAALGAELAVRGVELLDSASYINARQARWCYRLRTWEQGQSRNGPLLRLNQLRRAPLGLALALATRPLYAPSDAGAGLAIIARRKQG
jgi:SAM-dependent methyltransferase